MRFRNLRIAFSATCLIACVLLIALWVRSYSKMGFYAFWGRNFFIRNGNVTVDDTWVEKNLRWFGAQRVKTPTGTWPAIPFWLPTLFVGVLAGVPWLRYRFSLRTLLIATTLIAMVLGVIVWSVR